MPLVPMSVCSLARLRESSEARAVGLPTCSLKRSTEGGAWCWLALSSRLSGLVASSSEEGLEREEAGL